MKIIDKFLRYWNHDDLREKYEQIVTDNTVFMASLDDRQLKYYLSLGTSWYKAMTALETRVHELESKK